MELPSRSEAESILHNYVTDTYQRYHALMVGTAVAGYAAQFDANEHLWFLTGYFHDIDYEQYPDTHPKESLQWFTNWGYPEDLVHAVEAHALGFNGFTTKPATDLARVLRACDEISGIFYAYQKLNPIPFGQMKTKSIQKRLKELKFAPGIDRSHIHDAISELGIEEAVHINNLISSLSALDSN